MSTSDRTPVGDPGSDPITDSESGLPRTYGRTDGDELVQMRDSGCESSARESQTGGVDVGVGAISPLVFGRSLRFAEQNGAKVIAAVDLPESVLNALAALVDAVQQEFGESEARRREAEADRAKSMCRWHLGQIAEFCGPCRSEEIDAYHPDERVPLPSYSTPAGRTRAREIYETTRAETRGQQ